MATDLYGPDRPREPGEAGWRTPPLCYTRPPISGAASSSRIDEDGNAHVVAVGILLIAIWCVAAFLAVQNGWSL